MAKDIYRYIDLDINLHAGHQLWPSLLAPLIVSKTALFNEAHAKDLNRKRCNHFTEDMFVAYYQPYILQSII